MSDEIILRKKPWPLILTICAMVVILIGVGVFAGINMANEYYADLSIIGSGSMVLEYGSTYDEPGADALGYGTLLKKEPRPIPVEIVGTVDTARLGTYKIAYRSSFQDVSASAYRTVTVVDTTPPSITLSTIEGHFTFPGQPYEEEGFTASDNHDGDLTASVVATESEGKVAYVVRDSSGNQTKVVRDIFYDDPIPPDLVLKGETSVTITEGDVWSEPGFTALDNVDGDLAGKVTVSGTVDSSKPGTYLLTYEVKDGYENLTKVERSVTVKAKPVVVVTPSGQTSVSQILTPAQPSNPSTQQQPKPQPNGKVIYLTFDDGPSKHTARLLDTLAKYNAKATFFVCDTGYHDVLKRIVDEGHSIALHAKNHTYSKIYASDQAFFEDLNAISEIVKKYSGVTTFLMRFPGGSSNGVSKKHSPGIMTRLTKAVQDKGYAYFDWNIDSKDAGGAKTAEEVKNNVINGIKNSSRKSWVVLQHDIKGFSVDAVEDILKWGTSNGYTFEALTKDSPECHHGVNN